MFVKLTRSTGSTAIDPPANRRGLTLVELLVVIAILAIVSALLIPRLRTINKERNIREAGRLVASTFANASQRAVNEGISGVQILRNPNIVDANNVNYAGTTLYIMRNVPPYNGDFTGSECTTLDPSDPTVTLPGGLTYDGVVSIPRPFEQDTLAIVRVNDFISFNYNTIQYQVTGVGDFNGDPASLEIAFSSGGLMPLPAGGPGTNLPFVVYRQPQRIESSRVDLPDGYIIDLRFSGELNFGPDTSGVLTDNPRPVFYELGTGEVRYLFNSDGGLNRYYDIRSIPPAGPTITTSLPTTSQYFLIREVNVDESEVADRLEVLSEPSNLWVTVNQTTGASNVANVTPADSSFALGVQVGNARQIAARGQSTAQ